MLVQRDPRALLLGERCPRIRLQKLLAILEHDAAAQQARDIEQRDAQLGFAILHDASHTW
jgi:hypothetical protein